MRASPNGLRIATIAGWCWLLGCGRPGPAVVPPTPPPPPSARPAAPTAEAAPRRDGRQVFTLRGVVQAVDPTEGEVTIAHEAMPGFMEAMVMPFVVRKAILADIEPGDVVEGPMEVDFRDGRLKDYKLTGLTVTGTAPLKRDNTPPTGPVPPEPLQVGDLVPDFEVTTQAGAKVRLAELRGKVVALTFIYTRCPLPDFCPAADAKFADLTRRITAVAERAEHVALLSISFDPEHDTPDVLAKHAQLRGAKPPWSFAVANAADLARVGPLLGLDYYPDRDQFAHNLITAVVGPDGRLARLETSRRWEPADVARTIIGLIPRPARP